jgi:hypothetical protein
MNRLKFSNQGRNNPLNFGQITLDPGNPTMALLLFQDGQLFQLFCQRIVTSTVSDAQIVSWRRRTCPSVLMAYSQSIGKSHPVL